MEKIMITYNNKYINKNIIKLFVVMLKLDDTEQTKKN